MQEIPLNVPYSRIRVSVVLRASVLNRFFDWSIGAVSMIRRERLTLAKLDNFFAILWWASKTRLHPTVLRNCNLARP